MRCKSVVWLFVCHDMAIQGYYVKLSISHFIHVLNNYEIGQFIIQRYKYTLTWSKKYDLQLSITGLLQCPMVFNFHVIGKFVCLPKKMASTTNFPPIKEQFTTLNNFTVKNVLLICTTNLFQAFSEGNITCGLVFNIWYLISGKSCKHCFVYLRPLGIQSIVTHKLKAGRIGESIGVRDQLTQKTPNSTHATMRLMHASTWYGNTWFGRILMCLFAKSAEYKCLFIS